MKRIIKEIIEDKEITNWHIFTLLITIDITLLFIMNNYILTRETYGAIYGEQLEITTIDNIYIMAKKLSIWGYVFLPFLILLRVTIVSLLIQLFFMLRLKEISFKKLFRIILVGYGILVLSSIMQLVSFWITPLEDFSSESLTIVPLSITHLVSAENISDVYRGILNQINIFELLWIFLIALGLGIISGMKTNYASIVAVSVWLMIFLFKAGVNLYLFKIFDG